MLFTMQVAIADHRTFTNILEWKILMMTEARLINRYLFVCEQLETRGFSLDTTTTSFFIRDSKNRIVSNSDTVDGAYGFLECLRMVDTYRMIEERK